MAPTARTFKVKLASGRILGPLDLERIRVLILKNHIVGTELARYYPEGDWKDINLITEIAELFVARAEGKLDKSRVLGPGESTLPGATVLVGPTQVLPGSEGASLGSLPELATASNPAALPAVDGTVELSDPSFELDEKGERQAAKEGGNTVALTAQYEESTRSERLQKVEPSKKAEPSAPPEPEERTAIQAPGKLEMFGGSGVPGADIEEVSEVSLKRNYIAEAKTVVFQRSIPAPVPTGKGKLRPKEKLKSILLAVVLGVVGYQFFLEEPKSPSATRFVAVRPTLPIYTDAPARPEKSTQLYIEAMKIYVGDTVAHYKAAAEKLKVAASLDQGNVKALAMLASSYLNLIDASNKDENYFSVISKLIEMSRARNVELSETVIADVEFYITVNKPEAAQNRIVEFTKTHQNFGLEMFYYLALAFYHRGDAQNAARYLSQFPDNKVFSAKVFHLQGQVAEKLGDNEAAIRAYEKAVTFNKHHAKSRLRLAEIMSRTGRLKDAAPHLDYIVTHRDLLAPKELALGFALHSQLSLLYQKLDIALGDMERAVRLDKDNHDYLLELYTLRAKAGDKVAAMRFDARMYFFLGEGEKLLRQGKYQEALTQFLQARQANDRSPIPPIKIGDMFARLHDMGNARINYKLAAERAPNNMEVWSKYIDVLIQSYEWEEAQRAMDKFRKLPVPQSAIDKAAADMYAKQGLHVEAQGFYRKAMARDTIDPDVYIAYAKSLMATRNYKEAPFFFALALRFDPLNTDALIGTAQCVAATESIDRAINMMQDELQKGGGARAEFLAAIAEFQIQKGDWAGAQTNVEQAIAANPDYAQPWKLQAQIHLNREGVERGALDKALFAYQSYSERNTSDPSGYLERYKIFVKKTQFEKAGEELSKIYVIYPKYPNLHYYKGILYSQMGNRKTAIEEFRTELNNNPNSITALIAMGRELVEVRAVSESLTYFNRAMALAPRAAEPKHEAAYANHLLKNFSGAIALYNAALAYDKANPLIYKRLGLAYRDVGDQAQAAQNFRKYLEMEPDAPDRAEFERYR